MPFSSRSVLPFRRSLFAAVAAAALLSGCASKDPATTGSIKAASAPDAAIERQALSLRAAGKPAEAVALLQGAVARNPKSRPLALAYGRALADAGRDEDALGVLVRAQNPARPDWRIVNTEGAVLDRLGRTADAQQRYQAALKLAPEEPSILSNLGLSLALSDKPAEAEVVLRRAVAQPAATPKMRQNLALVLALQGKYAEAEELVRKDLSPEEAATNMRYWKQSLKPARVPGAKSAEPARTAPASGFDLRG